MMDQFGFQGMEEAFRHGMVPQGQPPPGIDLPAHALLDATLFGQFPMATRGIPAARSVCHNKPLSGLRFQIAIRSASLTYLVRAGYQRS